MPKQLIDLRQITNLGDITLTEFHLSLGALVPLSQCRSNEHLQAVAPALQEAARCIAAPSVRNLATLGAISLLASEIFYLRYWSMTRS